MAGAAKVKKTIGTNKLKMPKVFTADGLVFKDRPMLNFYLELKEHREGGLIKSFTLPTLEEQEAKSKYGAKKCTIDDIKFDSVMEAKFYVHLRKEQEDGNVRSFEIHPTYILQEGFTKSGKKYLPITYVSDFLVVDKEGVPTVIDVKGVETKDFILKKKMFHNRYRDLDLRCVQYRAGLKQWLDLEDIAKLKKQNKAKAKENN